MIHDWATCHLHDACMDAAESAAQARALDVETDWDGSRADDAADAYQRWLDGAA